jgi:hypothetical protein
MMETLQELSAHLAQSAWANSIRENELLFPLLESVHVIAICLVVGTVMTLDMRLLGLASVNRSVTSVARGILPLTWAAFAVAVISGGLLFISNASHYLANRYFDAKLCLIGLAGINMAIFHLGSAKDRSRWGTGRMLPLKVRLAGGVSILVWLAVVACGRWIGFTM